VAVAAFECPGRDVRRRRQTLGAGRALAREAAVVAGGARHAGNRRVVHRVGREARRRVGVAVAALDGADRDVRRRRHAGCGGAVVAARAVGVGGRMLEGRAGEAGGAAVAGRTILAICRDVAGERCRALRARSALAGVGAAVAGIAAAAGHRRMVHRVGRKARGRAGVATAAGDRSDRNVRGIGLSLRA